MKIACQIMFQKKMLHIFSNELFFNKTANGSAPIDKKFFCRIVMYLSDCRRLVGSQMNHTVSNRSDHR